MVAGMEHIVGGSCSGYFSRQAGVCAVAGGAEYDIIYP